MHNDMFPKWLGPFFIALYIIIDSGQVLDGNLTLGTWTESFKGLRIVRI